MADENPSTWIVVIAAILDFFLVFFGAGFAIALLTGGQTAGGFQLKGLPALLVFAIVVLYFWGMKRGWYIIPTSFWTCLSQTAPVSNSVAALELGFPSGFLPHGDRLIF